MKARRLSDLKKANRNILYDCIRRNDRVSISELERLTQLSRPTVTSLVRSMEESGMIYPSGASASSGGRSATLYSVKADAKYAIGVDCEFPMIRISIADLRYSDIAHRVIEVDTALSSRAILESIAQSIDALIAESGIPRALFLGVGVGLPGYIDRARGHSIIIERLRDWRDVPVADILSHRLGMPVILENDANLYALAEYRINPWGSAARDRVFIFIRHGVGMGVIMNGELLEGMMGNAGRIGHMSIDAGGKRCVCGNRGCLALYSSGHAIVARYRETGSAAADNLRQVSDLALSGDAAALDALREAGRYLGYTVVSLTNLYDVSYFTIAVDGTPLPIQQEVQKVIDGRTDQFRLRQVELHTINLAEDNLLSLGGCVMVVDNYIRELTRSVM